MQIVRRGDWMAVPWKNGGGLTYDIAVWPEGSGFDGFHWRLSAAEVSRDGPFSRFEGIDRMMAILSGAGLELDGVAGQPMRLKAGKAPFAFPGEAPVMGRLIDGPVLDLNLMVRRAHFAPGMSRLRLTGELAIEPQPVILVHQVSGQASIGPEAGQVALQPGDTAVCTAPARLVAVDAELLVMTVNARA